MPRANRLTVASGIFHITHRGHDQRFHLRFKRDRNAYRAKMREALALYPVALLDYCLTSNHVHLLVDSEDKKAVSAFMQKVAGEFARAYNRRKHRTNAVWGDSFHATLVDTGTYLQRCQTYIELNMVRCGVVSHPQEWEWVGYHEIMGRRQRYRLLDLDRLCWRLGAGSLAELKENHQRMLQERMARDQVREPYWSDAVALGRSSFVEGIKPLILSRAELEIREVQEGTWVLKEEPIPYGPFSGSESEPSQPNRPLTEA